MALVFVHGVNVRYDPANDPYVAARDAFFRRSVLTGNVTDPERSLIANPYWGKAGATFPWHHGGLPEGRYEQFGAGNTAAAAVLSDLVSAGLLDPQQPAGMGGIDPDKILLTLARHSLPLAVDRLWVAAAKDLDSHQADAHAQISLAVAAYVAANSRPQWLADARNDNDFLSTLLRHAAPTEPYTKVRSETFGFDEIIDGVRDAAAGIREEFIEAIETARNSISAAHEQASHWFDKILLAARTPIHQTVATFLGDAFVYFRQREADAPRQRIATIVGEALDRAEAHRQATGEPIIVVAHSMGGNIVYDLLTSSRVGFAVELLVTVGSQVAVFEEMKLFAASDPAVPNPAVAKVARPRNVHRWINVFDSADILGFAASRVFDGVEDYHFGTGHVWAHSGYFVEPMFYERFGRRLRGLD